MSPPDTAERRPQGKEAALTDPTAPTPIKSSLTVSNRGGRPECQHECMWSCPLHDCPRCTLEEAVYVDIDDLIDAETYWALEDWHDAYVDPDDFEEPCQICSEILNQEALVLYPGLRCEWRDCLHCEVCNLCMDSGRVCRNCRRCDQCAEVDGLCGTEVWSPRLGRSTWSAVHETYATATGKWG